MTTWKRTECLCCIKHSSLFPKWAKPSQSKYQTSQRDYLRELATLTDWSTNCFSPGVHTMKVLIQWVCGTNTNLLSPFKCSVNDSRFRECVGTALYYLSNITMSLLHFWAAKIKGISYIQGEWLHNFSCSFNALWTMNNKHFSVKRNVYKNNGYCSF